jgi:hypothetical protein
MDVPLALYRTFALGERVACRDYEDGVRWMWVSQYVAALRQNASLRSLASEPARLRRTLPRVRAFAYLSAGDPLPFVKSLADQLPIGKHLVRWGLRRLAWSRIAPERGIR